MRVTPRILNAWIGRRASHRSASRPSRRRGRCDWAVESLEGRTLLSTYTVVNLDDSGTGTLRWAIDQADQDQTNDMIKFAPKLDGGTIELTSGLLDVFKITGTLTIQGLGADQPVVSGNGLGQVFDVLPHTQVTINGLTITGGVGQNGPGIANNGTLTLNDCTVSGNTAVAGGGGGIDNASFGTMTITDSTISGNSALTGNGGGIANAGAMTISDSTISGNSCILGGNGGGLTNSGTLTIVNSTISGNSATASGSGGGIYNTSSLTMADDTVALNASEVSGGGIDNEAISDGNLSLSNTIVADNTSTADPRTDDLIDDGDVGNNQLDGQNDLIGSGDLGALQNSLVGVNPDLGPLQNNGGPTRTMALLPGSPAINAGDNAAVPAGIQTDQRGPGYRRIVAGRVDIGAFEFQRNVQGSKRGVLPIHPLKPDVVGSDFGLTVIVGSTRVNHPRRP